MSYNLRRPSYYQAEHVFLVKEVVIIGEVHYFTVRAQIWAKREKLIQKRRLESDGEMLSACGNMAPSSPP